MAHPVNRRERILQGNKRARKLFEKVCTEKAATPKRKCVHFGQLRKTRTLCTSPFHCGNPRRIPGRRLPTRQERRAEAALNDQS